MKAPNLLRVHLLFIIIYLGAMTTAHATEKKLISPCARMFLGSGGFGPYISFLNDKIEKYLGENVSEVVFIFYAQDPPDRLNDFETFKNRKIFGDRKLILLDESNEAKFVLKDAQAVYVGGGNTFLLLSRLYKYDLIEPLKELVMRNIPYSGISAGIAIASHLQSNHQMMSLSSIPHHLMHYH